MSSNSAASNTNNLFVPHQLRPIIGSSTYQKQIQIQQKLHQQQPIQKTLPGPATMIGVPSVPPPPIPPAFISTFMPQANEMPEKSYCSEPTPVVLSSAPKLYTNRLSINPSTEAPSAPQVNKQQHSHFGLHI